MELAMGGGGIPPPKTNLGWWLATAATVGGSIAAYLVWVPHYYVKASPVTGSRAAGINGSFRIIRSPVFSLPGGPDQPSELFVRGIISQQLGGIAAQQLGGACIAFRAEDLGFTKMAKISCTKNSDCSVAGENEYGYCDTGTKLCWSKPADLTSDASLCNRSSDTLPTLTTYAPNEDHFIKQTPISVAPFAVSAGVAPFALKPNAEARVVACLQGASATKETGCGSKDGPERMEVMGPILNSL